MVVERVPCAAVCSWSHVPLVPSWRYRQLPTCRCTEISTRHCFITTSRNSLQRRMELLYMELRFMAALRRLKMLLPWWRHRCMISVTWSVYSHSATQTHTHDPGILISNVHPPAPAPVPVPATSPAPVPHFDRPMSLQHAALQIFACITLTTLALMLGPCTHCLGVTPFPRFSSITTAHIHIGRQPPRNLLLHHLHLFLFFIGSCFITAG